MPRHDQGLRRARPASAAREGRLGRCVVRIREAATSLVMPGGSGAVATVSSNRSRSSDLKRLRLRYEFLPDWLGEGGTGERGVEFEAAHQFCVAPLSGRSVRPPLPRPAFRPYIPHAAREGGYGDKWASE
jgi:hypothetical protein